MPLGDSIRMPANPELESIWVPADNTQGVIDRVLEHREREASKVTLPSDILLAESWDIDLGNEDDGMEVDSVFLRGFIFSERCSEYKNL